MRFKAGLGVLCALAMGVAGARAGTMKPGLWSFTTTMPGMVMPQLPPSVLAQMKAAGVSMPSGNSISAQRCVTPEEAARDTPRMARESDGCTEQQVSDSGGQVSLTMSCNGQMQGTGTVQMSMAPDHFVADFNFTGVDNGHPVNQKMHIEGQYLSDTCPGN